MASIAEKLAEAKKAALEAGGIHTQGNTVAAPPTPSAPASSFKTGMSNSLDGAKAPAAQAPNSTTPRSVSALLAVDLIPRKTKESEVLFKSITSNFNTVLAGRGMATVRIHFLNGYLLTEDASIIAYLREQAKHFGLVEVSSSAKKQA